VRGGIEDALQLRPDYRESILELQKQNITVNFAKNGVLPKLDLVGSLNLLGFDRDFATSVGRIGRRDSNEWRAGFVFSYPLGNHAAKGDLNAARLAAAQGLVELQRIEQQIIVQVDNAGGQIVSDRARIASTTEASRLARESLEAGTTRLRFGAGTTFEILDLQRTLAEKEYAEVKAASDYNKAVAEFYRQTGTTLQVYRIDVK
jgi:outer membrane protein TolC